LINIEKLIEINQLIFCTQSYRPLKLQNSTTNCCYLLRTEAKSKKNDDNVAVHDPSGQAHKVNTVKPLYKYKS